jgi:hypothetical protein
VNTMLNLPRLGTVCTSMLSGERVRPKPAVLTTLIVAAFGLCPLAARAQTVTATLNTGGTPAALAVNPVTNKIKCSAIPKSSSAVVTAPTRRSQEGLGSGDRCGGDRKRVRL